MLDVLAGIAAALQGQMQVVFSRCSHLSLLQSPPNGFEQWYHTRLANNDTSEWPRREDNIAATCRRTELQQRTVRQVRLAESNAMYMTGNGHVGSEGLAPGFSDSVVQSVFVSSCGEATLISALPFMVLHCVAVVPMW
jgi:hypothetical protein